MTVAAAEDGASGDEDDLVEAMDPALFVTEIIEFGEVIEDRVRFGGGGVEVQSRGTLMVQTSLKVSSYPGDRWHKGADIPEGVELSRRSMVQGTRNSPPAEPSHRVEPSFPRPSGRPRTIASMRSIPQRIKRVLIRSSQRSSRTEHHRPPGTKPPSNPTLTQNPIRLWSDRRRWIEGFQETSAGSLCLKKAGLVLRCRVATMNALAIQTINLCG
jgi:hypothetical protein